MMDDQALAPTEPILEPQEAEDQAVDEALVEEQKLASSYFHPAWAKVQDDITETVAMLKSFPSSDLSADEYKIEALGRVYAANQLTNLLDRIRHAVEAVERTGRKPRKGAK